jgi:flagellar motor switch protein FliG
LSQGSNKKGVGISVAADMLSGLDRDNQKRVLELMAKKDPNMAELIQNQMVQIDHLSLMTVKMLQDFLKNVDLKELSLALKMASEETVTFFTDNVSKSMALEIKEIVYERKVPKEQASEAYQKVMDRVRSMVEEGSLVLKNDNDEYV